MSFTCGFFNAVNGDRRYTAEQMNNPYKEIVSNGIIAKTDDSDAFQVQALSDLNIVVKKGNGIFAGKWAVLDSDFQMTVPLPHVTYSRIDSVVIRINVGEDVRAGSIEYLHGVAVTNPEPPTLTRNSTITEYRLANIRVAPNEIEIVQADIEDTRPTAECGFVTNLLQNSDITATYRQWQSQFEEWLAANDAWAETKKEEHEHFIETEEAEFTEWSEEQEAEFTEWSEEQKAIFQSWFISLTETLGVNTVLQSYSSHYITAEENETIIPIDIFDYTSNLDVLDVYINGLKLIPIVDYTKNDFSTITLTKPVDKGTTVEFKVVKMIVSTDEIESMSYQLQRVNSLIPADCCETNILADQQSVAIAQSGVDQINALIPENCSENNKLVDEQMVAGFLSPTYQYTFAVDSDEALTAWATNAAGNDYTRVIIKKGTWTSALGVDLTLSKTKVVVGESESKLVFEKAGLYYDTAPTTADDKDYFISNVHVEVPNATAETFGFKNCTNLSNCTANCVSTAAVFNFLNCINVTNCIAEATGDRGEVFKSCKNLIGCRARCSVTNQVNGAAYCDNIKDCSFELYGKSSDALHKCNNVTNCNVIVECTGLVRGAQESDNIKDCSFELESLKDSVYGFRYCDYITTCNITVRSDNIISGDHNVVGVAYCNYITNCTIDVYTKLHAARGAISCNEISNCKIVVTNGVTFSGSGGAWGCYDCNHVRNVNCEVKGVSIAFYNCSHLLDCYGSSYSIDKTAGIGCHSCSYLTNCNMVSEGRGVAYMSCNNLTGCYGEGIGDDAHTAGFNSCGNLVSCVAVASANDYAYGYSACAVLTGCAGSATAGISAYGFQMCTGVSYCRAVAHCTSNVFASDVYASQAANGTYSIGDTPNGGFNNTTNPPA